MVPENSIAKSKQCKVEGCGRESKNGGYCWAHYYRLRRHGNVGSPNLIKVGGICSVDGCGIKIYAGGYCSIHYQRVRKHGNAGPSHRLVAKSIGICSVEGCGKKANCGNYCYMHYERIKKYGDAGQINPLRRKNGMGTIDKNTGYCSISKKDGSKNLIHRIIAENVLGKKLPKDSVVHHVDGNKLNNNNDNLVICENDSYHKLIHKRQKALELSGHADWIKCVFCKKYDDPNKIHIGKKPAFNSYHKECANKYARDQRRLNKFSRNSSPI